MKHRRPIILIFFGILLLVWVWYYTAPPPPTGPLVYSIATENRFKSERKARIEKNRTETPVMGRMPHMIGGFVPMPTGAYVEEPETNDMGPAPVVDPKYTNAANWPEDARQEVKKFYEFAKVVRPYKFDPAVTYFKDEDFPHFTKAIGTATHFTDMDTRNWRIEQMSSYRDRSHSFGDYPGVTDEWANATGTWHKRQMVEETFRILRELGPTYAETLKAVTGRRQEFELTEWRVKLPEGGFKIVYPFATVKLYGPNVSVDPNEGPRVTAQYRMGPDGPVGLVDWDSRY
jgi:hypothetical protein